MNVVGVVVVVEMDGRDNMELGMEDIEDNVEDIVDFSHNVLPNLVSNIGFGVEMAKVSKVAIINFYYMKF